MSKHTYEVNGKHFAYRIEADTERSRVYYQTGIFYDVVEHFENGDTFVIPQDGPKNFIGTKADEYQRMFDEQWNQ